MTLKIAWSVDDVVPIPEHGLNREEGNFKYLFALNKEFGAKFTLFTTPNYKGVFDIRNYVPWCEWLKSLDFCEIAAHGFTHHNQKTKMGTEFFKITESEAENLLNETVMSFNEVGIRVRGFKFPGWLHETEFIDLLPKYGFGWLADHFVSIYPLKLTNGFYRIPYTLSTGNLHSDHYKNILILHSHISVDQQNKNGFNDEHYIEVRKFLKKIVEKNKGNVKFVTFSELLDEIQPNEH